MGVLRRDEIIRPPAARWKIAVPEIEGIVRKRQEMREICTTLFDSGFASTAVKLLFRENMSEDARDLLRKLKDPKDFEQEYAKIIILRKTGDAIRAKNMINSTREEKTIEEMELLGIELAKIDPIAARALVDANLEKHPKNMEILIAVAKILEAMGDPKTEEIKTKIRKKMTSAQYPRKVRNRANLVLFGEKTQPDRTFDYALEEDKKEIDQRISRLPKEEVEELCLELEDLLKGHYFEIKDPENAREIFNVYTKLRERAIQIESEQIAAILEILETRGFSGVALAIGEVEKINWKFSERRGEIVAKIANVALEKGGTRLLRSVVAKMAIESRQKKVFLEVIEVARKNNDGSSVAEKYDQAIEAKLLNFKDASKEAKKIEETDMFLATRIRSQFEELIEEMLDSLILRSHEIDTQTFKDCIKKIFEIEEIRRGKNSRKVEQLMRIYEKRRDRSEMN